MCILQTLFVIIFQPTLQTVRNERLFFVIGITKAVTEINFPAVHRSEQKSLAGASAFFPVRKG